MYVCRYAAGFVLAAVSPHLKLPESLLDLTSKWGIRSQKRALGQEASP